MHPDSEPHNLTTECIACSQLCVCEEKDWVCTSCRRVYRRIRVDNESHDLGDTPSTAHDDTYGSDDELAAGDHPTTMVTEEGTQSDCRTFDSSGTEWLGYSQNESGAMVSPSRVNTGQGICESGVENCNVVQDGQGQDPVTGDPDEDVDPMDVDGNDEDVYRGPIGSWVAERTIIGTSERSTAAIEHTIQLVDLAFLRGAHLTTPAADDRLELSDDTEMDE
ncbi:unnamed protein product [Fusarium graminearum]|uniref:Uncharacterized protein n=1 Tax=Gibberella zeae TaxID=5518 RepID=A0A2H3GIJ9_GIBZA|nr:hypothetical protein FG05_06399 [Fusarium graminearum]KAI6751318.1 hypothetical protein HG531_006014 [Fusarium graminearum]PCD24352.1 hypothetical protein FGRA07_11185 [Fusarium graminearum]CAF3465947.1 unnamed protein product [Fusarium graminearum]CAF3474498.1 unnamed protein product [Fusarium graminearum]